MKKFILSAIVIFTFAGYALFANKSGSSSLVVNPSGLTTVSQTPSATTSPTPTPIADNPPAATPTPVQTTTPTPIQNTPTPTTAPTPKPTATPTPTPTPKGQYADGQYTGSPVDNDYGTVQVQAVISGGKLANVVILQSPNDRGTSRQINGQAMPYLQQEAIQAQSANVNIISGATQSSEAFMQSLASALVQAKS